MRLAQTRARSGSTPTTVVPFRRGASHDTAATNASGRRYTTTALTKATMIADRSDGRAWPVTASPGQPAADEGDEAVGRRRRRARRRVGDGIHLAVTQIELFGLRPRQRTGTAPAKDRELVAGLVRGAI